MKQFCILVTLIAPLALLAQVPHITRTKTSDMPPSFFRDKPQYKKWDFSWVDKTWKTTGGEPYAVFRHEIDSLGKRADRDRAVSPALEKIAQQWRTVAKKHPLEPLPLFKYAYSAYMACQVDRSSAVWTAVDIPEVLNELRLAPFPGQAEYARMIFLMDDVPLTQPQHFKLGKRLFGADQEDRRVLHKLVNISNPRQPSERLEAIQYANLMVEKWPDFVTGYSARAGLYFTSFVIDPKRKSDGLLAIEDFKECLRRLSEASPARRDLLEHIKFITDQMGATKS